MFVTIEGVDGSGKGTQTKMLAERLRAEGKTVEVFSFPRYTKTRFGGLVGKYLNGDFGTIDQVSPWMAGLLYAGDRFESRDELVRAIEDNDYVICDRYIHSNIAHQVVKIDSFSEREKLKVWLYDLEYEIYRLPKPDQVILLSVGVKAAVKNVAQKAARTYTDKAADIHEADQNYLMDVIDAYWEMSQEDKWGQWTNIKSVDLAGNMYSPAHISDMIRSELKEPM